MEGTPETLLVGVVHLSLGAEDRSRQLAVLAERLSQEQHVVLMGDFNCSLMSMEMRHLWRQTQLDAKEAPPTFPSWNPQRTIDHILATPSLQGGEVDELAQTTSDHLMVTRTIHLPGALVA
jgi:endonuclease/exonuclease/phosphatase family metal-dependent hydrolase